VQVCLRRCVSGYARVHPLQCGQARQRPVRLPRRDGPVQPDDGVVREAVELVVPLHDLHPVGLPHRLRVGVQGGDRGLHLVLAEPIARQRRLQDRHALGDQLGVPPGPVLLR